MLYRVQEWLADRTRMQYPRVKHMHVEGGQRWGANFSPLTKIALALLGLPLFVIGVLGTVFCLYLLYVIVSSFFK